jgi:hypothetical protein
MNKKSAFSILITLILMLFTSMAQAVVSPVLSCSEAIIHSADLSHADYRNHGMSLEGLSLERRALLEKYPAFIFSPRSPSYEDLMQKKIKFSGSTEFKTFHAFDQQKSFEVILKLFTAVKYDADYYFVGNGFYIPYLMAKSLFAGTPMENRIKYIAFSSRLAELSEKDPQLFSNYYNSIGIGHHPNRKIIILDSLTGENKPNQHGIIRTSNSIRKHLMASGWDSRHAIDHVITMGLPEFEPLFLGKQKYQTKSLEDYEQRLHQITFENMNTSVFPYLDPKVKWSQEPFVAAYHFDGDGNEFYWNGKYKELDEQSWPRGKQDVRQSLKQISDEDLQHYLSRQSKLAAFYLKIIQAGLGFREPLKNQIESILHGNF